MLLKDTLLKVLGMIYLIFAIWYEKKSQKDIDKTMKM